MPRLNYIRHLQNITKVILLRMPRVQTTRNVINAGCAINRGNSNLFTGIERRHFSVTHSLEKRLDNKKPSKHDADSDSEDEEELKFMDERDSKVVKANVNSLRADLLLKAGLGIARNKIENIFYESRIRVNGKKLPKKSVQLYEGDEIDVIRGFSQTNPSHLVVSRVVILSAEAREESLSVHLRRYKSLLVENYKGSDAFKSASFSDH